MGRQGSHVLYITVAQTVCLTYLQVTSQCKTVELTLGHHNTSFSILASSRLGTDALLGLFGPMGASLIYVTLNRKPYN